MLRTEQSAAIGRLAEWTNELGPGGEDTFIGDDEDFSPTFAMTIAGAAHKMVAS
jgi:hypothetical protein